MVVIHTVSFASEGPPHDAGLPLGQSVLDEWGKMCIAGGSDTYEGYTPQMMREMGEEWSVKEYSDEHIMELNPTYHKIGLGAWRAVILRKAVEAAKDGEVVVVHCSNYIRSPCMKYFAANLRRYVESIIKFTDLFSPPHNTLGNHTPAEALALIPDPSFRSAVSFAPLGRCRVIIARVTPRVREFVKMFEEIIKADPLLLSPANKTANEGLRFCNMSAEQAVFNVLAYREGFFPMPWQNSWIGALRWAGCEDGCGVDSVLRYGDSLP